MRSSFLTVTGHRLILGIAWLCVGSLCAFAGEIVLLKTGYSLRAERHETVGDRIRLHGSHGGITDFPVILVESIEKEPAPPPAKEPPMQAAPVTIDSLVAIQSANNRLHPELLYSVIAAESNFDPGAVSSKGAIGLMQLMPQTAAELEVDPYNPAENVEGGAAYLRFLLDKYAGSKDQLVKAIAAYNAGPAAVDRYDGIPPYRETQNFVSRVLKRFVALAESKAR